MSLSTALRFEQNPAGKSNLKQAFQKQQERIQRDEMMAARENVVRLEKITNQRAEWNENLELACWKKRIRNDEARIQDEVKQAAKASITVRRIALQQLLEKDHEIYEKELNLLGKTFFKQRM